MTALFPYTTYAYCSERQVTMGHYHYLPWSSKERLTHDLKHKYPHIGLYITDLCVLVTHLLVTISTKVRSSDRFALLQADGAREVGSVVERQRAQSNVRLQYLPTGVTAYLSVRTQLSIQALLAERVATWELTRQDHLRDTVVTVWTGWYGSSVGSHLKKILLRLKLVDLPE